MFLPMTTRRKRYSGGITNRGEYGQYRSEETTVDRSDLPYVLTIQLSHSDDGRSVCSRLVVEQREGGTPVTSDGMRRLPLARLIRDLMAEPPRLIMKRQGESLVPVTPGDESFEDDLAAYLQERRKAERKGRRRVTDEDLQRVADVYRKALHDTQPPGLAVQRVLKLRTPEQARRWISKAREAGFLGEAPGPRQIGEKR
jgi:hypothetical protein